MTSLKLSLFFAALVIAGCGSRTAAKKGLTPDEAFARLKPSSTNPLLCNTINGYGCARLSLSTSSGEQSITHEDFLVTCQKSALGISVSARDQAGIGAGLSFGFSATDVAEFTAEKYTCGGFELTNDPVIAKWKPKSCQVYVRYGEMESWTIKDEPCTVTIDFSDDQWRGVIDCPRLTSGTQTWNFNDPAVFTCPK
jgi:hypothetical protein